MVLRIKVIIMKEGYGKIREFSSIFSAVNWFLPLKIKGWRISSVELFDQRLNIIDITEEFIKESNLDV